MEEPTFGLGVALERPRRRDLDIGVLDALIEEIGIFDDRRDDFGILHFDNRVLAEEAAARAELVVVLEEHEEDTGFVIAQGELLDQTVDDLDFFFRVRFDWKELGDFFEESEGTDGEFGLVGFDGRKTDPAEQTDDRETDSGDDESFVHK